MKEAEEHGSPPLCRFLVLDHNASLAVRGSFVEEGTLVELLDTSDVRKTNFKKSPRCLKVLLWMQA